MGEGLPEGEHASSETETRTTRLDEAPTRLAPMAPSAPPRHRAATANGQHCSLGAQLNRRARTSCLLERLQPPPPLLSAMCLRQGLGRE